MAEIATGCYSFELDVIVDAYLTRFSTPSIIFSWPIYFSRFYLRLALSSSALLVEAPLSLPIYPSLEANFLLMTASSSCSYVFVWWPLRSAFWTRRLLYSRLRLSRW